MKQNEKTIRLSHSRVLRAFSLIEILVVIAIIALLIGLTLAGGVAIRNQMNTSGCQGILSNLKANADEFKVANDLHIPHLDDIGTAGVFVRVSWTDMKAKNVEGATGTGIVDDTIERYAWYALKGDDTGKMLRAIGKNYVGDSDGDGFVDIVDPWGTKIYYAYEVVHDDSTLNGTTITDEGAADADDFLPEYPKPFFASAGPDGLWGDASSGTTTDTNGDGVDDADDNLYSYEADTQ